MKKALFLLALAGAVVAGAPAQARTWNPKGVGLAQDYSVIVDNRPNQEIVMLMWLSSPLVQNSPTAQALLDKYIILGLVHGKQDVGGKFDFDPQLGLTAKDSQGTALKALSGDEIPLGVQAAVVAFGGVMKQSFGAMGQGMQFFVFEASDSLRACGTKGRLIVPFAGTDYTYDTPIPGCPAP